MDDTLESSGVTSSTADTEAAWTFQVDSTPRSATFGPTGARAVMDRVGSMMSSIGKWLMEARSFEITGAGILFNGLVLIGLLAICLHWTKVSRHSFWMDGKHYRAVGLFQMQDKDRVLFSPVYTEEK